jgi:hypothetical protein
MLRALRSHDPPGKAFNRCIHQNPFPNKLARPRGEGRGEGCLENPEFITCAQANCPAKLNGHLLTTSFGWRLEFL